MVSFRENIKNSLDTSLKNRDEISTATLRLILAAIKDHDIQFRTKKKGELISDEEILNLLQNMIKQRKESVKIYAKAGRTDLKKEKKKKLKLLNPFYQNKLKLKNWKRL